VLRRSSVITLGAFAGFARKGKGRFDLTNLCGSFQFMNAHAKEIELNPHKLTVDELLVLDETGAFARLPKLELLDGKLYEVNAQKSPHAYAKTELGFLLYQQVKNLAIGLSTLIEPTIKIPPYSAPEPDIAIVSTAKVADYYPAEIVKLVVEISSTTLRTDLQYKKALYADAGIPEYWVVDVAAKKVHTFWLPEGDDYRETSIIDIGNEISSQTIARLTVDTAGIL
jgi:Uma2 family endonuclease